MIKKWKKESNKPKNWGVIVVIGSMEEMADRLKLYLMSFVSIEMVVKCFIFVFVIAFITNKYTICDIYTKLKLARHH